MPEPGRSAGPLGVLGGTFDPVHRAHLHLARAALRELRLTGVLWIPAGQPYHRHAPQASPADRLEMVRLAVADEPHFLVDDTEALATTPSFTVPTLERLRRSVGDACPLVLLMGADAFLGLPTWHRWQEVFRLAHVAVAARPGAELDPAAMAPELADQYRRRRRSQFTALATVPAGTICGFEIDPVEPADLSATAVRALLAQGAPLPPDLLPAPVVDYIRRQNLYSR